MIVKYSSLMILSLYMCECKLIQKALNKGEGSKSEALEENVEGNSKSGTMFTYYK